MDEQLSTPEREGSAASANPTSSNGAPEEKPRLTEQEKKANHIASEQKRRAAIRDGFDRLAAIVPGLENSARSEGTVLRKTVDYIRETHAERRRLIASIEGMGGRVEVIETKYIYRGDS